MRVVGAEQGSSLAVSSYRDMQNATNNNSHKLGAGGLCSVFEGVQPGSKLGSVAVALLMLMIAGSTGLAVAQQIPACASKLVSCVDYLNATVKPPPSLGAGGFGCVFKGILPDSTIVAVKKLESVSQGEKQFHKATH